MQNKQRQSMRRIHFSKIAVLTLWILTNSAFAEIASFKDGNKTWRYKVTNVLGWKLYVEESISKQEKLNVHSTLETFHVVVTKIH